MRKPMGFEVSRSSSLHVTRSRQPSGALVVILPEPGDGIKKRRSYVSYRCHAHRGSQHFSLTPNKEASCFVGQSNRSKRVVCSLSLPLSTPAQTCSVSLAIT